MDKFIFRKNHSLAGIDSIRRNRERIIDHHCFHCDKPIYAYHGLEIVKQAKDKNGITHYNQLMHSKCSSAYPSHWVEIEEK